MQVKIAVDAVTMLACWVLVRHDLTVLNEGCELMIEELTA